MLKRLANVTDGVNELIYRTIVRKYSGQALGIITTEFAKLEATPYLLFKEEDTDPPMTIVEGGQQLYIDSILFNSSGTTYQLKRQNNSNLFIPDSAVQEGDTLDIFAAKLSQELGLPVLGVQSIHNLTRRMMYTFHKQPPYFLSTSTS